MNGGRREPAVGTENDPQVVSASMTWANRSGHAGSATTTNDESSPGTLHPAPGTLITNRYEKLGGIMTTK
jgi:hypothetical protein